MTSPKTKKSVKVIKTLRSTDDAIVTPESVVKKPGYSLFGKILLVAILGTVLYLLAYKYRNLFLAGTLNNYPISRSEINRKLIARYGKQAFDEVVNERLLSEQIKKNNIVVTDEEVKSDMDKMIQQYGSQEAFNSALEQFGLTTEQAKLSIKQSIGFKKLIEMSNKIVITDEAIKKYFDDNKDAFKGKKLEEVSASIKDSLYQKELLSKSQELFTNIRKEAKINSYL